MPYKVWMRMGKRTGALRCSHPEEWHVIPLTCLRSLLPNDDVACRIE